MATQPGWSPQEKCESQLWTRPSSHRHNQLRRPGPRLHKVSFSIISGEDWTEIVYSRLQSVCDDCGERRPRAARRGRNPSASIHMISTDDIDIEYWWCHWITYIDKHYRHPFECLAFVCDSRQTARRLTFALANAFQVKKYKQTNKYSRWKQTKTNKQIFQLKIKDRQTNKYSR